MTSHRAGRAPATAEPLLRAPLHLGDFRCAALGQVVSRHRRGRRISREAFAELIGVPPAHIDTLESGQVDGLSISALWTMADILGVDLAELLHETRWRVQELAAERWTTESLTRRIAS